MPNGLGRASDLVKRLYGQRTSSHGGMYVVRRKGLLDEIPHLRLIRGVILVRTEDADGVANFLHKMAVETHMRRVMLTNANRKELGS